MRLKDAVDLSGPLEIIVVEDHDLVREELVDFLQSPGVTVRGADDSNALEVLLKQRHADVLIVDLNLPVEDGLSICRRMRQSFPEMGLVMLTARILSTDRAAGYQNGADVYLTKPANLDELEAAVANLARRIRRRVANGLQLDIPKHQLTLPSGTVVNLTLLESRLLYELASAPERMLSTAVLIQRLCPSRDASRLAENLPVTISRLRQKMASDYVGSDVIKAVRGFGYKLTVATTIRT